MADGEAEPAPSGVTGAELREYLEQRRRGDCGQWESGQAFGKFRIERRYGEDAYGVTCEAIHQTSGARVALHILRRSLFGEGTPLAQRFDAHIKKAHELRHPGIQKLVAAGRIDGWHYYAAKFLPGVSLRRLLEEGGALEWRRAVRLGAALARALEYGHARGLCHEEIKPSNVVVGEDGSPVLLAYGVPRDAAADFDKLAREQARVPFYQAPEILRKTADPSPATDLYSLGALLYHLMTGRPALEAGSLDEAREIAAREWTLSPAGGEMPEALRRLVGRLTCRESALRYASAALLLEELLALLPEEAAPGGEVRWLCPVKGCFAPLTASAADRGRAAFCPVCGEATFVPWHDLAAPPAPGETDADWNRVKDFAEDLCPHCGLPEKAGGCCRTLPRLRVRCGEQEALAVLAGGDDAALLALEEAGATLAARGFHRRGETLLLEFSVDGAEEGACPFEVEEVYPLPEAGVMQYFLRPRAMYPEWRERRRRLLAARGGEMLREFYPARREHD